jgi:hypothetical protein
LALRQGDLSLARSYLVAGDAIADAAAIPGGEIYGREGQVTDGQRIAWLEYELITGALDRANDLASHIGAPAAPPTIIVNVEGHFSVAAAKLALLEGQRAAATPESLSDVARFVHTVEGMARMFPSVGPRANLLRGRLSWLEGEHRRALKSFRSAAQAASRLRMPLDEALAEHLLAARLPLSDPTRDHHRDRALEAFAALGVGDLGALAGPRQASSAGVGSH